MNFAADSFPKCTVDNDKCLAQGLTYLMEHSTGKLNEFISLLAECDLQLSFSECPELGVPKFDPYESPDPFILRSTQLTSLFTAEVYWSNITAYGFDRTVIQEAR